MYAFASTLCIHDMQPEEKDITVFLCVSSNETKGKVRKSNIMQKRLGFNRVFVCVWLGGGGGTVVYMPANHIDGSYN